MHDTLISSRLVTTNLVKEILPKDIVLKKLSDLSKIFYLPEANIMLIIIKQRYISTLVKISFKSSIAD